MMIINKCDVYVNFQIEKQEMLMIQKKAKKKIGKPGAYNLQNRFTLDS